VSGQKLRGNKFRLFGLSGVQERMLLAAEGCNRYVYNKGLAMQKAQLEHGARIIPYPRMAGFLVQWKAAFPFLKDAPAQALQQTLRHLDRAVWDGLDRASDKMFPVFKKKGRNFAGIMFPQGFKVDEANARIYLPKVGWVRYRKSRELAGTAKSVCVTAKNGKWYATVLTDEGPLPDVAMEPSESNSVGIDKGIAKFYAASDGRTAAPLNALRRLEKRLAHLQRKAARQVKGSNNWRKTVGRIAALQERIANQRKDFIHKETAALSKSHAFAFAEDLKVKNMARSAKGTAESPGRNVAAKSGLNKSIMDQGWGEFDRQMEYKMRWRGGAYIKVNPAYTSQECPVCGHTAKANRPSQAAFRCERCGHEDDADINAAINIKKRGLAECGKAPAPGGHSGYGNACGGRCVGSPAKQEPAEGMAA
jgi:putative transposase